jgi:hypothetical protein
VQWRSFLVVCLIGALTASGLALLDRARLLPRPVNDLLEAAADIAAATPRSRPPRVFPRHVFVDFDQEDFLAAEGGMTSAPVRAFDRSRLARVLAGIRENPEQPAVVVVDIDVAPRAPLEQEKALRAELEKWVSASRLPMLLLVRSDCSAPPRRGVQRTSAAWQTSPSYDDLVAPTATAPSRLLWVCAAMTDESGESAQSFEPYGCARRPDMALPAPGVVAWWLRRQAPGDATDPTAATRFLGALGGELKAGCAMQPPRTPVLLRSVAVLSTADEADVNYARVPMSLVESGKRAAQDMWPGAAVVIGQTHERADDRHATRDGERPGALLLLAHLEATASARLRPQIQWWNYAMLNAVACMGAVLSFGAASRGRDVLIARHRDHVGRRRLIHFMLAPQRLVLFSTVLAVFLLMNLPTGLAWRELLFTAVGILAALECADVVQSDNLHRASTPAPGRHDGEDP